MHYKLCIVARIRSQET